MVALGQLGRGGRPTRPLTKGELGSVRKACDDELQRRCYVEKSSRTKCRKVFKEMLTEPALKCWHHRLMWLLSERPLGRSSTRRLCAAVGQFSEMQIAVSTR